MGKEELHIIKKWKKTWKQAKQRGKPGKCPLCHAEVGNLLAHQERKHKSRLKDKEKKRSKMALRDYTFQV